MRLLRVPPLQCLAPSHLEGLLPPLLPPLPQAPLLRVLLPQVQPSPVQVQLPRRLASSRRHGMPRPVPLRMRLRVLLLWVLLPRERVLLLLLQVQPPHPASPHPQGLPQQLQSLVLLPQARAQRALAQPPLVQA